MKRILFVFTIIFAVVQPGFCSKGKLIGTIFKKASEATSHSASHSTYSEFEHYAASKAAIIGNKISKQEWDRDSTKYRRMYLDSKRYFVRVDSAGNRLILPAEVQNGTNDLYPSPLQNEQTLDQTQPIQASKENIDKKMKAMDSLWKTFKANPATRIQAQSQKIPTSKPIKVPDTYKYENDPDYFPTIALCLFGMLCMVILPAILIFRKKK